MDFLKIQNGFFGIENRFFKKGFFKKKGLNYANTK